MIGPRPPSPTTLPSISRTAVISAAVPVKNASSAPPRACRASVSSETGISMSLAIRIAVAREIPGRIEESRPLPAPAAK